MPLRCFEWVDVALSVFVGCGGGDGSGKLVTEASPKDGGTVSRDINQEKYPAGTNVTLTATPAAGYRFKEWTGAISGNTKTIGVATVGNMKVTAVFEKLSEPGPQHPVGIITVMAPTILGFRLYLVVGLGTVSLTYMVKAKQVCGGRLLRFVHVPHETVTWVIITRMWAQHATIRIIGFLFAVLKTTKHKTFAINNNKRPRERSRFCLVVYPAYIVL